MRHRDTLAYYLIQDAGNPGELDGLDTFLSGLYTVLIAYAKRRLPPDFEPVGGAVVKTFSHRTVPAGTEVFREGYIADCAYLLKSGKVEITTYRDGKYIHLTTIRPNQLFGELALIDKAPRSATATALEGCEFIVVRPEDIARHVDGLDEFMKYWLAYLTDRIRDLSKCVQE